MANTPGLNDALKNWKILCQNIQRMAIINPGETKEEQLARIKRAKKDYAFFEEYYFPHIVTDKRTKAVIPPAKFQVKAANEVLDDFDYTAVWKWPRGCAKSTHVGVILPLWLKIQDEVQYRTCVLVSKSEDAAKELLGDLQAELQFNERYIHDFGKQVTHGKWQDGNFNTKDGKYYTCLGREQSPRGLKDLSNRPDLIIVDDIDDDVMVKNDQRITDATNWVKEALMGTMGAEGGRFIMVGNAFAKNMILLNICKITSVKVSTIYLEDKNGNSCWPEYWTKERIKKRKELLGYRGFQRECMHNPITEGSIFKFNWIKWVKPYKLKDYDKIVAYCDPSFKGTTKNDFKAIKVWGVKGTELHCLFAFCRQCSVTEMVRWFYDLHEKMPEDVICDYYMEANFLQDIILDEFTSEGNLRGYQLPIRPDHRKKPDKFQRVEAISPLWERGFVSYNIDEQNNPDMIAAMDQTLAFEKGTRVHDDAPDADEGAIYIIQQSKRQAIYQPVLGSRPRPKNEW